MEYFVVVFLFDKLWKYDSELGSFSIFHAFYLFSSDTTNEITTMDSIQGDWWILKGQNCGQDEIWNGGYDAYPCQKVFILLLIDDD